MILEQNIKQVILQSLKNQGLQFFYVGKRIANERKESWGDVELNLLGDFRV